MQLSTLKVGEIARRTGVSIRTLHYYDEIGLLSPSLHSESGHRLYAANDVERLQQIKSMQQLGFSLQEINECLSQSTFAPLQILSLHIDRIEQQIAAQQRLRDRLTFVAARLERAEEVSVEEFLQVIGEITMIENYYTPEQLEELRKRRESLGEEGMKRAQDEWTDLIARARAEMEKGSDPASEPVQEIAAKWQSLIDQFTGGNPGIRDSLEKFYKEQPQNWEKYGIDKELSEFMAKARAAAE